MANAFTVAAARARAANEERYTQGMGLWDEIIERYQPGGGYGEGALASYERGKTKAVGAGMQQLVSSGLANTTVAATIGKKYEEEVGTPFKLQLQDVQSQRLSEAQAGKAGFIERRTDAYPDAGLAAQLGQQVGQAQGIQTGGYGAGGYGTGGPTSAQRSATRFSQGIQERQMRLAEQQFGASRRAGASQQTGPTSTYNPAGLNMEQLYGPATYGEPGGPAGPPLSAFSPTGAGGEAKSDIVPYDTGAYHKYVADFRASGEKGGTMGGQQFYERYTLPAAAGKKKAATVSKVGTTSYAAKGGGFGGRGF